MHGTIPDLAEVVSETASLPFELIADTVAQAPIAISITDTTGRILYVNQNFTDVTGYSKSECLGRNESMLSDQRTPRRVYQELWRTIQNRSTWQGTLINRHRGGKPYLAHLTISPIHDESGEITHFIGMHRDITDVFHLEQQVKNQKVLIETVVDLMPVAAVLLDEASRVVLSNQMYKELVGHLRNEEPAALIIDLLIKELGEQWQAMQITQQTFRNVELRIERGGQLAPRWFTCSGSWFNHGGGDAYHFFQQAQKTYLLLTVNDITQRRSLEESQRINALKALMAEEEKSQEVREAFLGAIHHIESPHNLLTAARTLLERRSDDQNAALVSILDQVLCACNQSVTKLKASLPPVQLDEISSINLNQLIHETIILLRDRLLREGIVVDWKPAPVLPKINGMERTLRSMFKHLMENAIEALNHPGLLRREIRITTDIQGEFITIGIGDSGPGITADMRMKVFEPFFSTKHQGERRHSGVGLSIAQEVVTQHQGFLSIDPDYREGCRVLIQLPTSSTQQIRLRPAVYG